MSDILKLQTNVPEVIAFQFSDGKEVQSDFTGQQFMFTLVDGRRVYLPPVAAAKIKEAGVTARVPFEICRRQVGRSVEYHVVNHNNAGSTAETFSKNAPAAERLVKHTTSPNNTPAPPLPPVATAAVAPSPIGSRLMAAFAAAIDVAIEVTAYADRRGFPLELITEDIRAMATTLFIEANKNGGRL